MELEWIEKLLDRRNPHQAKISYDPLRRYDNEVPAAQREKP
jgi:hypothetical protein